MQREEWSRLYGQELGFFAAISASFTHEIKNHLAIINEQNGLLGDMLVMDADNDHAYRERMGKVIQGVADQVIKTDMVVRRFNTFAHTADKPLGDVDIADIMMLFGEISARLARCKGATVTLEPEAECVTIRTRPFELLHLLFCVMNLLLDSWPFKGFLRLGLESDVTSVYVRMAREAETGAEGVLSFDPVPSPALSLLLQRLHGRITFAGHGAEVILEFPRQLQIDAEMDCP